jgi:hypothetical protein
MKGGTRDGPEPYLVPDVEHDFYRAALGRNRGEPARSSPRQGEDLSFAVTPTRPAIQPLPLTMRNGPVVARLQRGPNLFEISTWGRSSQVGCRPQWPVAKVHIGYWRQSATRGPTGSLDDSKREGRHARVSAPRSMPEPGRRPSSHRDRWMARYARPDPLALIRCCLLRCCLQGHVANSKAARLDERHGSGNDTLGRPSTLVRLPIRDRAKCGVPKMQQCRGIPFCATGRQPVPRSSR